MAKGDTEGSKAVDGLGTSLATSMQNSFAKGPSVFDRSLYAGIGGTTKRGIDQTLQTSKQLAGGLNNAFDWSSDLLQSGGWGTGQLNAAKQTQGVASKLANKSAAEKGYMSLYGDAKAPSLTEKQLMGVATGKAFGQEAPGYARLRANALDDAMSGVGSAFLTNGRFGSSVMGDAAGEAATDVLAGMDYQNYQNDIARQERALAAIEGQRQQGFQNQFSSLGAADNARLAQTGARLGALQQQFGMGQQGLANQAAAAASLPALFQAALMPGQAQTAAGQILDADRQASLLGRADLFDRKKNAQSDWEGRYLGMLGQLNGAPGTQKETPWWQSVLGYVANNAGNAMKMF